MATKVGFIYDDKFLLHSHPQGRTHPEVPTRVSQPYNTLKERHVIDKLCTLKSRKATPEELTAFHDAEYVENLEKSPLDVFDYFAHFDKVIPNLFNPIFNDEKYFTYRNEFTYEAAVLSAGSALQLTEAVIDGTVNNGFALLRPPGHHAGQCTTAGFCFFNNVAMAAKYAQSKGVKKVMIVDWDIHHGNGTQDCFYEDDNVLYVSLHKFQDYPRLEGGKAHCIGEGKGQGYNINIAWEGNDMGDEDYKHAFDEIIMPIGKKFSPDLVLVSCGFDACNNDLLGTFKLSYNSYSWMTKRVLEITPKVAMCFEGGYNIENLCEGVYTVIMTLLGEIQPEEIKEPASDDGKKCVELTKGFLKEYWF